MALHEKCLLPNVLSYLHVANTIDYSILQSSTTESVAPISQTIARLLDQRIVPIV